MNASADRLLRRTLWGNAAFSVISGAVLAVFATPFAAAASAEPLSVAGLDLAVVFELLGVGVVAFGALCAWIASRERLPEGWARAILAADIAWVAASAVVLLLLPASWTTAGVAGIVVVALIVADLAILEYLGLRRLDSAAA